MTIRIGLLRKKVDWTSEQFSEYWRDTHGSLAAQAPGLRDYWQNFVTERLQRGIDYARGPWDFDGFSQLSFDDAKQADHAFNESLLAADLIADENRLLGGLHILTTEQRVVIPVPGGQARSMLLKRISILKRRPDISESEFRREWAIHGDYVKQMPGVSAYRQNIVVGRELVKGEPCSYEDLPIDGVVELWFEDKDKLAAAFASERGQVTMNHATTFLHEITAFLVQERQVVGADVNLT